MSEEVAEEEVYLLIYIDGDDCLCTNEEEVFDDMRYKRRHGVKKYVSSLVHVSPNLSIYNFGNDNYRIFAFSQAICDFSLKVSF